MKGSFRIALVAIAALAFAGVVWAGTFENEGKAWLDEHKDAALVNVSGNWDSEFGKLHLVQAENSRDVSGDGGGYKLAGVVSGKSLYLLFVTRRSEGVDYCAVLNADSETSLSGDYRNRVTRLRFGKGLCQEKGRKMYMKKQ